MARTPNKDEAAAIAAAIQRFVAETAAPAADEQGGAVSPWQRAALAEGIGAKRAVLDDPKGGLRWLW
jgi:hypothetical protein